MDAPNGKSSRLVRFVSNLRVAKVYSFLRARKDALPEVILLSGIVAYASFFSIYLIQKYEDFRTGYFDFGLAVQTVWLASRGLLNGLAFGRPITLLAGILYAVYPHPETLLSMQSFALAIGALPIYLLAKVELGNKWHAMSLSQLYLINPLLWGINQYEFHDLAFCVPFLLFAFYYYRVRKVGPYTLALLLSLTSSPFAVIIAFVMTISFLIDSYVASSFRRNFSFTIATLGSCLGFVLYLQAVPLLPVYQLSTVGTQSYTFVGSTVYVNPLALLADPLGSLAYSWPQKCLYILSLLGPVLFLPVLSKHRFLPAIPWLGVVVAYTPALGAGGVGPVYLFSQWTSFLMPSVFVGVVYGVKALRSSNSRIGRVRTRDLLVIMIVLTLLTGTFFSGLSPLGPSTQLSLGDNTVPTDLQYGIVPHGIWPTPVKDNSMLDWLVTNIPKNYSILAQNQIGSKLGERLAPVYIFYQPGYKDVFADVVIVDSNLDGLCTTCLSNILSSGNYTLRFSYIEGGIYLYYRLGLS